MRSGVFNQLFIQYLNDQKAWSDQRLSFKPYSLRSLRHPSALWCGSPTNALIQPVSHRRACACCETIGLKGIMWMEEGQWTISTQMDQTIKLSGNVQNMCTLLEYTTRHPLKYITSALFLNYHRFNWSVCEGYSMRYLWWEIMNNTCVLLKGGCNCTLTADSFQHAWKWPIKDCKCILYLTSFWHSDPKVCPNLSCKGHTLYL